jgi:hypothetical protein
MITIAQKILDQFEQRTRSGEDTYWSLKKDAPEWMTEFVHEAHGDMFPDDHRYEFIRDALEASARIVADVQEIDGTDSAARR